jgi:hypothetical protein
MGKVAKADGSADVASFTISFVSQPDVWATFNLGLTQPLIDFYTAASAGNFVQIVRLATDDPGDEDLYLEDPDIGGIWFLETFGSIPAPVEGWQLCEIHYDGSVAEFYIDGTLVSTTAPFYTGDASVLEMGLVQSSPNDPSAVLYVDDVKVGTTRGATDVFSDDFESGDFSAWDTTFGDVSVVDDPFVVAVQQSVRVLVAFTDDTLTEEPDFTDLSAL